MGLEASVTIVDGHMMSIDTVQRVIQLADGSQLTYDLLLVTTGLQVLTTCQATHILAMCLLHARHPVQVINRLDSASGSCGGMRYPVTMPLLVVLLATGPAGPSNSWCMSRLISVCPVKSATHQWQHYPRSSSWPDQCTAVWGRPTSL